MNNDFYKKFALSSWSVNNTTTIWVITFILFIGGLISYYSMPRENFPEIIETKIFISSTNPGNSAEDVEKFITEPLEEEFEGINGVKDIVSSTFQDYSLITVEFNEEVSIFEAKQRVKDKVDIVKSTDEWPIITGSGKVEPYVFNINLSEEMPIMNINISSNKKTPLELKEIGEILKDQIERISEIKEVVITGANDQEVEIGVDLYKMISLNISFNDIINALKSENITISGGSLSNGNTKKNIRLINEFNSISDIENIVVKTFPEKDKNKFILVRDLAEVNLQQKEINSFSREFQSSVVMLSIKKRSGKNMIEASEKIKKLTDSFKDKYIPKDTTFSITNDLSNRTKNSVDDLVNNIIFGVVLVVLVIMFFLGLRNALFIGVSIPLSMLLSYIILYSIGITLNTMVLFALVMGLGMLVDNALVIVENIYSHKKNGLSNKEASIRGASEVAWPIIASTATTLAAFLPLALWPGTMGKFMIYFPLTLSIVLGSSLFVALVISPMLTSFFLSNEGNDTLSNKKKKSVLPYFIGSSIFLIIGITIDSSFLKALGNLLVFLVFFKIIYNRFFLKIETYFRNVFLIKLEAIYKNFLIFVLKGNRSSKFVLATFGLLIFSFALLFLFQPKVNFFPVNDPNQVDIYIELPDGTDIEKTNKICKYIEKQIYKDIFIKYTDGRGYNFMVESMIAQVGKGSGNANTSIGSQEETPHKAKINLVLREFKLRRGFSSLDFMNEIRNYLKDFSEAKITVEKDKAGPPAGYPINIEIKGEDYNSMLKDAELLLLKINSFNIAGIEKLNIDANLSKPEMIVKLDNQKIGALGLSSFMIGNTIRQSIYGEKISTFKAPKEDYDIIIRAKSEIKENPNIIFNQPIHFKKENKSFSIPISSVADFNNTFSFNVIKHDQLKKVINIYSNVTEKYNGNNIVEKLKLKLKNYTLSKGNSFVFTGEQEKQQENMSFLVVALLIAIASILLILVAQFNSIAKPLIIITAVVLSFIGVFLGLIIFNMDFIIIMTMLGIISLAGIVVNNAIVLIDYTELLITRKQYELGLAVDKLLSIDDYVQCIVKGGVSRLKPVLLTAITTILGLLSLAVGLNIDFFNFFINYNPNIYLGGDNVIFLGTSCMDCYFWTFICNIFDAYYCTSNVVYN